MRVRVWLLRRRVVEQRRRVAAAEVHGGFGGGGGGRRRRDEAGGEVAVAGVVALRAARAAVALVEIERVAERVVVELPPAATASASSAVVVVPWAAPEPPDEGLPPRPGHQLRPLPHLEHRVHGALPPALLLRPADPLVGRRRRGPGEAAAPPPAPREEGRLRFVHPRRAAAAAEVGVHRIREFGWVDLRFCVRCVRAWVLLGRWWFRLGLGRVNGRRGRLTWAGKRGPAL